VAILFATSLRRSRMAWLEGTASGIHSRTSIRSARTEKGVCTFKLNSHYRSNGLPGGKLCGKRGSSEATVPQLFPTFAYAQPLDIDVRGNARLQNFTGFYSTNEATAHGSWSPTVGAICQSGFRNRIRDGTRIPFLAAMWQNLPGPSLMTHTLSTCNSSKYMLHE
jgi:hypothetical protein